MTGAQQNSDRPLCSRLEPAEQVHGLTLMEEDLLIAHGWEGLVQVFSVLLLLTFVGVTIILRRSFEGSFFVDSVLFFAALSAGAIMLLILATELWPQV